MKSDILNKKIDLPTVLEWLDRNYRKLCSFIVLMYFCSPFIEMITCLFSSSEREFHGYYRWLILYFIHPVSVVLGLGVIIALIRRARKEKVGILRALTKRRLYLYFTLMAIWILLSTLVNHKPILFDSGDWYRGETISLILSYFLILTFSAVFVPEREKETLSLVSVVVSIILGIYSSVRYCLMLREMADGVIADSVAVFDNSNHYGYYLAVHIMLCSGLFALSKRRWVRAVALVGLVVNTAVLSTNNTFGAWLACFIAFIFQIVVILIARRKIDRRSLIAFAVYLLVTFIMSFWTKNIMSSILQFFIDVKSLATNPRESDSAGTTRWKLWKFTVGKIRERPIFGFGNEGIDDMLCVATGCTRPHNELLQYAVFYGIPAALIYLAGVFNVYINGYKQRASLDDASIICLIAAFAYLVSSMFGNTMFYTAPFFFLLLGMGYFRPQPISQQTAPARQT